MFCNLAILPAVMLSGSLVAVENAEPPDQERRLPHTNWEVGFRSGSRAALGTIAGGDAWHREGPRPIFCWCSTAGNSGDNPTPPDLFVDYSTPTSRSIHHGQHGMGCDGMGWDGIPALSHFWATGELNHLRSRPRMIYFQVVGPEMPSASSDLTMQA